MKKTYLIIFCILITCMAHAQELIFSKAKFQMGDRPEWKSTNFDDSSWGTIKTTATWGEQGCAKANSYGWYRIRFVLPESMLEKSDLKKKIYFYLGKIDDADETFLNGVRILSLIHI